MSIKKAKLTDFQPDPRNANKGTQRGRGMLEHSLQYLGAGRSVVADRNNVLIAGNKTLTTAVEAGFEDAIVVETDGTKLVVVKRTDLDLATDVKAKELAIADNRTSEVSLDWETSVLLELQDEGVDLSQFWLEDELTDLLEDNGAIADDDEEQGFGNNSSEINCVCPNCGHEFVKQLGKP